MAMGKFTDVKSIEQMEYLIKDRVHENASVGYFLEKSSKATIQKVKENAEAVWYDPHGLTGKKIHMQAIRDTDLYAITNGFNPDTGEKLTDSAGTAGRSGGTQFSLSAPKPMSLLLALDDDKIKLGVLNVQREADLAVAKYINENLLRTSSGSGRSNEVGARGSIAILSHLTARMEDGLVAPDIHTHYVVMGFVERETDGEMLALNNNKMNYHRSVIEKIYDVVCCSGLQKMGIETKTEIGKTGFTIPAMEKFQPAIEAMSLRSRRVMANMAEKGFSDNRETWGRNDNAAAYTKRNYKVEKTKDELDESWRDALNKAGNSPEEILRAVRLEIKKNLSNPREKFQWNEKRIDKMREAICEVFHEKESTFHEGQLIGRVAAHMCCKTDSVEEVKAIASKVKEGLVVVGTNHKKEILYASQQQVAMDRELIELAKRPTPQFILSKERVEKVISDYQAKARAEKERAETATDGFKQENYELNEPQLEALRSLTYGAASCRLCGLSEGSAGSGKTLSSQVLKLVYDDHGFEIHGIARGWRQAKQLEDDMRLDHAKATEGFLRECETGKVKLNNRSVVVVDECGLMSARDAHRLFKVADAAGAKVVMQGDSRQLNAIGTGCMLSLIDAVGATRIGRTADEIMRQRIEYQRQAGLDIATGNAKAAIDAYGKDGKFTVSRDKDESVRRLVADVKKHLEEKPDKSCLVIANRNSDVRLLNSEIREAKRELGIIKGNDFEVLFGDAEGKDTYTAKLAVGEKIQFRSNQKDECIRIYNRNVGFISSIEDDGKNPPIFYVDLADGRKTQFSARTGDPLYTKEGSLAVEPAHCQTIQTAQGATESKVFGLDAGDLDQRLAHILATRHRDDVQFYVDKKSTQENTYKPHAPVALKDITDEAVLKHVGDRWSKTVIKDTTYALMTTPAQRAADFAALSAENKLMIEKKQHQFELEKLIPAPEQTYPVADLTLNSYKDYSYEQLRCARTVAISQPDYQPTPGKPASLDNVMRLHDVPRVELVRDGSGEQQVGVEMFLQNAPSYDVRLENGASEGMRRARDGDSEAQVSVTTIFQPGKLRPDLAAKLDTAPIIIASNEESAERISQSELDKNQASSVFAIGPDDPALSNPVVRDIVQAESRDIYFTDDVASETRASVMQIARENSIEKTENEYHDLARDRQREAERTEISP